MSDFDDSFFDEDFFAYITQNEIRKRFWYNRLNRIIKPSSIIEWGDECPYCGKYPIKDRERNDDGKRHCDLCGRRICARCVQLWTSKNVCAECLEIKYEEQKKKRFRRMIGLDD
ncbi:MAG: hypothetical protein D6734_08660 [Candidatus Schekmanbacteria bacterium]|nr:MAG: hypothetical protein D6734_08660 [Candidatus Schekmanbacteria bacterium]